MLTEYEVRQRMETIRSSRVAPLRKARLLLRLGRSLHHQTETITAAREQAKRSADKKAVATLARMAQRTAFLHDDIRQAAVDALTPEKPTLRPS